MARPQKEGLEYFPLDVDMDQDDKIALIEAQHGVIGFGIVVKLLMKIYKHSYYYEWTEKEQLLFSKRVNVDINSINVIINDCVKWGIFDKKTFETFKILTSRGIQRRYLEAIGRRQKVNIIKEYLLLDNETINVYKNLVIVDINPSASVVNVNINPQSKVKESKVKESKEEESKKDNTAAENKPVDNLSYVKFFNNNMGHLITPFELQTLQSFIDDGMEPEVITMALQEAVNKDAREMSYIKAILNRWLEHGLKTVASVTADKKNYQDKKKSKVTDSEHKSKDIWNNYHQRGYDFGELEKAFDDNLNSYENEGG